MQDLRFISIHTVIRYIFNSSNFMAIFDVKAGIQDRR